jgi:hypothetical protein
VAFVGGVDGYGAASMVFADGPHPREICPGKPVHLGDCGHGAFGGTVAAPPYFAAMDRILAGRPDQPVPGPDPAYLDDGARQPVVPDVVGTTGDAGSAAVSAAGHPVETRTISSSAPVGQVVGESPQGNAPAGTPVTLWVSGGPPS